MIHEQALPSAFNRLLGPVGFLSSEVITSHFVHPPPHQLTSIESMLGQHHGVSGHVLPVSIWIYTRLFIVFPSSKNCMDCLEKWCKTFYRVMDWCPFNGISPPQPSHTVFKLTFGSDFLITYYSYFLHEHIKCQSSITAPTCQVIVIRKSFIISFTHLH